jgi:hypothetical protein
MLNQPSQYDLNAPDELCTHTQEAIREKKRSPARTAGKTLTPLKVFSKEVPQGLDIDAATKLASQMGMTTAQLLSGTELPKATIAQKYVYGQPLVDDEKLRQIPTNM